MQESAHTVFDGFDAAVARRGHGHMAGWHVNDLTAATAHPPVFDAQGTQHIVSVGVGHIRIMFRLNGLVCDGAFTAGIVDLPVLDPVEPPRR
jgi:hypothetical protein